MSAESRQSMWSTTCPTPESTRALGVALGHVCIGGTVVGLVGELGAGKTCFAQGVGMGLDVEDEVVSPTFALMHEYKGRHPLLHADVYRLSAEELPGIGLEEELEAWPGVGLVEWADRFPWVLPENHMTVRLTDADGARVVEARSVGAFHDHVLYQWRSVWESRRG